MAETAAAEHGQTVCRDDWRLTVPVHLAETKKEALAQARRGAGRYQREYFEHTIGRDPVFDGPIDKVVDFMVDAGTWIVGTPDDCIEGLNTKRCLHRSRMSTMGAA